MTNLGADPNFSQLLHDPRACRMLCDIEVQDTPTVVTDDEKAIERVEAVWGMERGLSQQSVDTYVWRLQQKLEENPQDPTFITTVRGTGYMFQFLD